MTPNEGPGYIIEGIGSDNGLIESFTSLGWSSSHLICVRDSSTIYFDSGYGSAIRCQLVNSIEVPAFSDADFLIIPNPFSSETTITAPYFLQDASLRMYNSQGSLINVVTGIYGKTITLQRNHLPSGLFYIQIEQDHRILMQRKVLIS